jgi:hypothetical protein
VITFPYNPRDGETIVVVENPRAASHNLTPFSPGKNLLENSFDNNLSIQFKNQIVDLLRIYPIESFMQPHRFRFSYIVRAFENLRDGSNAAAIVPPQDPNLDPNGHHPSDQHPL